MNQRVEIQKQQGNIKRNLLTETISCKCMKIMILLYILQTWFQVLIVAYNHILNTTNQWLTNNIFLIQFKKNKTRMSYSRNQFEVVGGQIDFYDDTSPSFEISAIGDSAKGKFGSDDIFESLLHIYDEDLDLIGKNPPRQSSIFPAPSKENQLQIFDSTNNKSQFELQEQERPPGYGNEIGSDSSSSQQGSQDVKNKKNKIKKSKKEDKSKLKSSFKNFLPICKRSLYRLVKGIDCQEKNKTCLNEFNGLFHNLEMRQSLAKVFLSNSLLRELQNSRIDPSNRLLFLSKVQYLKKAFIVGKLSHL